VQDGAPLAVVGIGLNYLPDAALARRLRRPVASLKGVLPALPERNFVIRAVAEELLGALRRFERAGVEAVRDEWSALHAHAGQRLKVRLDDGRTVSGIAAGLAEDGALRLQTRGGVRAIRTGHVIAARVA
jgi:biotin-(acetyl-CoA carboxylase) ligase